jgi:tripartite-type tricarboxylate transporter receptor subunit TctC
MRPDEITFSAASPGSPAALVGELFNHAAGIKLLHVPYKALPGALMDVIAGQIQLGFTVPPLAIPQLKAKRLRHLAIATGTRSGLLPEVPTFTELGYPAVVATGWYALVAPAGTPAHIVQRVYSEVARALKLPDIAPRIPQLGMEVIGSSPAECGEFIRAEQAKWAKFIKTANIRIDTSAGP